VVSGIGFLPEEIAKPISIVALIIGTVLYKIHTCFIDVSMYKGGIKLFELNKNKDS